MQVSKIYRYESLFYGNKKKKNDKKEGSKGEIIIITDDINKMLFFAIEIFTLCLISPQQALNQNAFSGVIGKSSLRYELKSAPFNSC